MVVVVVEAGAVDVVVGATAVVVVGGAVELVVEDDGRPGAARRAGREVQAPAPTAAAPRRRRSA